ncbi:hypothetical protein BMS3Abin07_01944 [bacterium BMS3Abin07]|nr:hypothetical protein BMS3Abin07_01944 [bacterium BMS3Abin07]GBE32390.1 hypothetical protein BMS3Bbin05_01305 [bacterium BMS3Bbin05]HDL20089.1 hypothetical protein [Nitrospirota bacterium]HDO22437.1 hypothetical protein [Nitrospirota bacterium]HDZ87479.1 hypothetical protein [Nitrospirota bacterium]
MPDNGDLILVRAGKLLKADGRFAGNQCLVIRGGLIESITDGVEKEEGRRVLDLSSKTITPPFHDYHLHFSGRNSSGHIEAETDLMKHGIFSVDEGGDSRGYGLEMERRLKSPFRVKACGYAIYRKGGYGKYIGRGVSDVHEAKGLIDELISKGAGYIKVINSGVFDPASGRITKGGFERDVLEKITGYANKKGLDVTCHANGDDRIRDAVLAGASSVVHGFSVSGETLHMMRERGVSFVPTVNALNSLKKVAKTQNEKYIIDIAVDAHLNAIKEASDAGVRVLPGSDAGPPFLPYGSSFIEELEFFRKAGMSPEQILAAAVTDLSLQGQRAVFIVLDGSRVEHVYVWKENKLSLLEI